MRKKAILFCAAILFASGSIFAQQASPDRQKFLQTWAEAKAVLENAQSNGQGPACSAEASQLHDSMLRIDQGAQKAIALARANNMSDPLNNALVDDYYKQGLYVFPPLIQLTRQDCGV